MAKDVLEVLNAQLDNLCVETPEDQAHFDSMKDAAAKLSELIAADVEYDEAELLWIKERRKWFGSLSALFSAHRRYKAAIIRRAAALAACRGL